MIYGDHKCEAGNKKTQNYLNGLWFPPEKVNEGNEGKAQTTYQC